MSPTRPDQAFVALFTRYEPRLFTYCRSILGNEDDARDAVQNTAVQALVGFRDARVHTNPRAWLFRIARNEALGLVRSRRVADPLSGDEPDAAGDPAGRVIVREELTDLVGDLEALSSHARQALLLREASGLGYDEIAGVLNTTPGAVRQAVTEARGALRADRQARETGHAGAHGNRARRPERRRGRLSADSKERLAAF
jgi:RNA polymerase sigma factor (sigma-70 family)